MFSKSLRRCLKYLYVGFRCQTRSSFICTCTDVVTNHVTLLKKAENRCNFRNAILFYFCKKLICSGFALLYSSLLSETERLIVFYIFSSFFHEKGITLAGISSPVTSSTAVIEVTRHYYLLVNR